MSADMTGHTPARAWKPGVSMGPLLDGDEWPRATGHRLDRRLFPRLLPSALSQ